MEGIPLEGVIEFASVDAEGVKELAPGDGVCDGIVGPDVGEEVRDAVRSEVTEAEHGGEVGSKFEQTSEFRTGCETRWHPVDPGEAK